MNSIEEQIAVLSLRIRELSDQQNIFKAKLFELTRELEVLKAKAAAEGQGALVEPPSVHIPVETVEDKKEIISGHSTENIEQPAMVVPSITPAAEKLHKPVQKPKRNLEEFLGKNLASKVGILVTIIGIFIGAKYAVEHNLVSERLRIVLGYLSAIALIAIGWNLRKKYPAYSAVLMGGGLCVAYIITYIAFAYFQMFPRMVAFGAMVLITVGIVYAALLYNRVVIAHLAMVGAYSIPFLLSDNSGNYPALFSYMAIINAGLAVLSFKKYWKSLLYASFLITWFIYAVSFIIEYDESAFTQTAWIFLSIFFGLFYSSVISYKLTRQEKFLPGDVLLLIPNAFIFFGFGMNLLEKQEASGWQMGLFALLNALIHAGVAILVRKKASAANTLCSLLTALAIIFVLIAVPVTFDAAWVVLVWAAQAVLLYYIGRSRKNNLFLYFSIVLQLFTLLTLVNWYVGVFVVTTGNAAPVPAVFNEFFLTALFALGAFGLLIWLERTRYKAAPTDKTGLVQIFFSGLLPGLLIFGSFMAGFIEVNRGFRNSAREMIGADGSFGPWVNEVMKTCETSLLIYALVYSFVLLLLNRRWFNSKVLEMVIFGGFLLLSLLWVTMELPLMNQLAADYYHRAQTGLYFGSWNLIQRYIAAALIAGFLYLFQPRYCQENMRGWMKLAWPLTFVMLLSAALSFEYLLWTKVSGANNQYKYGLSVLWGLLALALIIYGIWKKHRIIRLIAMVMLVITLIKLVFFDMSNATSLTRTITYIALGGILLLISYLYNRYKDLLFGKDDTEG